MTNSTEILDSFAMGLAGIHGRYDQPITTLLWNKAVSFIRGHFKEIFTL